MFRPVANRPSSAGVIGYILDALKRPGAVEDSVTVSVNNGHALYRPAVAVNGVEHDVPTSPFVFAAHHLHVFAFA